MLTKVSVVPPPGAFWPSLVLPVLEPSTAHGLFITKIDGLEPVSATVNTQAYGLLDGEFYNGTHVGKRNIVLHIGMETRGVNVGEVRRMLYPYFMSKRGVILRFEFTDRTPVEIDGWGESVESDRFSKDPEMNVSIICPKPNFRAYVPTFVEGRTEDAQPVEVPNLGDQSVGIQLQVFASPLGGFLSSITVEILIPGEDPGTYFSDQVLMIENVLIEQNTSSGGFTPEYLYLDTNQGQKTIEIRRDIPVFNERSLLAHKDPAAPWPMLHQATHLFRVTTPTSLDMGWMLTFQEQFGGI